MTFDVRHTEQGLKREAGALATVRVTACAPAASLRPPVTFALRTVLAWALALVFAMVLALLPFGQHAFAAEEPLEAEGNIVNTSQQPDSSFIYETSITELANADSLLDKQTVQVTGEVVGDIVNAADANYCWVTLMTTNEKDDSVVSVYMGKQAASAIDTLGRYSNKGTTLQVSGTFHLVCHDHQGLSDIHATSVSVVSKGEKTDHPVQTSDVMSAVVCFVVGIGFFFLFRFLRERRR